MSLIIFITPQLLVSFLNKGPKVDKNIIYLFFAFIFSFIWLFLPREISHVREVNFLQHFVGGGLASGLVTIYLVRTLGGKYEVFKNFFFQFVFLYALVCSLSVANELLEFFLDYFKYGIFSSDRYDTWFDLFANTSGALLIFATYKTISLLKSYFEKSKI